jgi:SAM-dependent methyltransferase
MSNAAVPTEGEFDRCYAAEQLRRSRHPLRRFVKGFYLREMLRDVRGSTIDFGCGAGQLLTRLPPGSVGLEVNPHLIEALRGDGLTVRQAHGDMQDFELDGFEPGRFQTLVIAHVLEHLPDPTAALRILLASCGRLGIERVVVVVPGAKGFASDHTHKTFIDADWLQSKLPTTVEGFHRSAPSYFPGRWAWVGRHFVFHELKLVFTRRVGSSLK